MLDQDSNHVNEDAPESAESGVCSTSGNESLNESVESTLGINVPEGHGLLVQLEPDGKCSMTFQADFNWKQIHPNVYAPLRLTDVKLLKGGGSGVTVFQGESAALGSLVMKHGGHKDLTEVFSLAVVARELHLRGINAPQAAQDMRSRIPQFMSIYISPHHLRDRRTELWIRVRSNVRRNGGRRSSEELHVLEKGEHALNIKQIKLWHSLYNSSGRSAGIETSNYELDVIADFDDKDERGITVSPDKGFQVMKELVSDLIREQELHLWKFTIAQKAIGHPTAKNEALVHTSGLLKGKNAIQRDRPVQSSNLGSGQAYEGRRKIRSCQRPRGGSTLEDAGQALFVNCIEGRKSVLREGNSEEFRSSYRSICKAFSFW